MAVLFVLIGIFGCVQPTSLNPKIFNIYTRPNQVNLNEEFKVFFSINNPTDTPFTPYIALDYPTGIEPKDFNIRQNKGQKIPLTSIQRVSSKSYSFEFHVNSNANFGIYPIKLGLYDKADSLAPLGALETVNVEVVEIIQTSNR